MEDDRGPQRFLFIAPGVPIPPELGRALVEEPGGYWLRQARPAARGCNARGSLLMDKTQGGLKAMRTWRLSTLAAVLTVVMTGTVFSADTVKVFRYDGSLQCGMGQAVPLDEMAKELTAVNINVLSSEKRVVPGFIIALCGAPTGIANVYEIAKDDLPRLPADQQGVKRFQPWVYDGPSIEVAKYDGSLQCEMGRPVSLDEMEKELRAANIAVEGKAKKADGIQHPQMCGASTGMMNVYRIPRSDFEKARALGFVLYIEGISIARDRRGSNVAIGP